MISAASFVWAVFWIACLYGAVTAYNQIVQAIMRRKADRERDPKTGILRGAEPIFLEGSNGAAVLLVHGFIGSPTDYGELPRILNQRGFAVSVPLLPGHGTDPRDFSKTTPEQLESAVLEHYQELKSRYREVTLVGFSMGGALGILTAARIAVDRLILLAPYLQIRHRWFYLLPAEWHNQLFMQAVPYVYSPKIFKQALRREIIHELVDYNIVSLKGARSAIEIGRKAARAAHGLRQPVLIIHSTLDKATDYHASKRLSRALSKACDCRFVTVSRTNHMLLWDHDRERVIDEIVSFLNDEKTVLAGDRGSHVPRSFE